MSEKEEIEYEKGTVDAYMDMLAYILRWNSNKNVALREKPYDEQCAILLKERNDMIFQLDSMAEKLGVRKWDGELCLPYYIEKHLFRDIGDKISDLERRGG